MSAVFVLTAALSLAAGYLLGSVNTALVLSKLYRTDIRKQGSGNAGLTNTMRIWGKKAAFFVLAGDVLKGVLACLAGMLFASLAVDLFGAAGKDHEFIKNLGVIFGGFGSIVGHNWPLYFGFKGGKGVLTTLAVVAFTDWRIMLLLLAIFIAVLVLFRFVSLGSVIAAACFPVISIIIGKGPEYIVFSLVLAILIILKHNANIRRLLNGNENRFSFKR